MKDLLKSVHIIAKVILKIKLTHIMAHGVYMLCFTQLFIKPNTHRRRDATVELSRVGSVYGIGN